MTAHLQTKNPQAPSAVLRHLWRRLPLPENHVAAIALGFVLQRQSPLRLPRRLEPVGWLLLAAGIVANAAAVRDRRGEDLDEPEWLTTGGMHGMTRNPMYVGWTGIHIGGALLLSNGWILAMWPISFALTHWSVVSTEEPRLAEQFGEEYARYQKRVPRYLGRVHGQR